MLRSRSLAAASRRFLSVSTKKRGRIAPDAIKRNSRTKRSPETLSAKLGLKEALTHLSQGKGVTGLPQRSQEETEQEISLAQRAEMLQVRLTQDEIQLLAVQAGAGQDLRLTRQKFITFSRQQHERDVEREAFLAAIEEPARESGVFGKWLLSSINMLGTASFAVAGAEVAGDAGMNIIGCTFVGCVSALGGGSVNAVLFGYARHGVPWVQDPSFLVVAMLASVLTFLLWPLALRAMTDEYLKTIHHTANDHRLLHTERQTASHSNLNHDDDDDDVSRDISREEFLAACADARFYSKVRAALRAKLKTALPDVAQPTSDQLFDLLDLDHNGRLDPSELQTFVLLQHHGSLARYVVDTVALCAAAVTGAAAAISRGLHPAVCAVSGVSMCFGGILRDLMCGRDVAACTQSFAASTAAGATVHVAMRELCLRSAVPIPLNLRVALSAAATVGVRVLDYHADGRLLPPMHAGRPAQRRAAE